MADLLNNSYGNVFGLVYGNDPDTINPSTSLLIGEVIPIQAGPVNQVLADTEDFIVGNITNASNFRNSLFNLVNSVSLKKYRVAIADFVKPTRSADNSRRNTMVLLVEQPDLGLFNAKRVWYNRIHTSVLGNITLYKGSAYKVIDLLSQININLNTTILASELVNFILPDADASGRITISLLFNDKSFRYYSGTEVILTTASDDQSLSPTGVIQTVPGTGSDITIQPIWYEVEW